MQLNIFHRAYLCKDKWMKNFILDYLRWNIRAHVETKRTIVTAFPHSLAGFPPADKEEDSVNKVRIKHSLWNYFRNNNEKI